MKIKCVRCGACCLTKPCPFGNQEIDAIICTHLRYNKNTDKFACQLLIDKIVKPHEIGIGRGCVLRTLYDVDLMYAKAQEFAKMRLS